MSSIINIIFYIFFIPDGTQVKETPTSGVPYASSPVYDARSNQIWLPILLGCIAGILALALLFCLIHRSQKQQEESGWYINNSAFCISSFHQDWIEVLLPIFITLPSGILL